MGAYRTYQTTPVAAGGLAPTFLTQPGGQALEGGLGDVKDALADRAKLAAQVDLPLVAPADALPKLGVERGLQRGPSETDGQFAARCQNAWSTWPYATTPFGLLLALYNLGYTNVYLMPVRGAYATLNGSQTGITTTTEGGGSWTIDPNAVPALAGALRSTGYSAGARRFPDVANGFFYTAAVGGSTGGSAPVWPTTVGSTVVDGSVTWCCSGKDLWSRFDVLFPAPLPSSWGGGPPASNSDEANRIRVAIAQWKPAFAICDRIVIITSGKVFGYPASQVWGAATGNWGSSTTTVWTP